MATNASFIGDIAVIIVANLLGGSLTADLIGVRLTLRLRPPHFKMFFQVLTIATITIEASFREQVADGILVVMQILHLTHTGVELRETYCRGSNLVDCSSEIIGKQDFFHPATQVHALNPIIVTTACGGGYTEHTHFITEYVAGCYYTAQVALTIGHLLALKLDTFTSGYILKNQRLKFRRMLSWL